MINHFLIKTLLILVLSTGLIKTHNKITLIRQDHGNHIYFAKVDSDSMKQKTLGKAVGQVKVIKILNSEDMSNTHDTNHIGTINSVMISSNISVVKLFRSTLANLAIVSSLYRYSMMVISFVFSIPKKPSGIATNTLNFSYDDILTEDVAKCYKMDVSKALKQIIRLARQHKASSILIDNIEVQDTGKGYSIIHITTKVY